jgi:predicted acetyltransferase
MPVSPLILAVPALDYLPAYVDALERDWSPNSLRPEAAREELARIADDPSAFLQRQTGDAFRGGTYKASDGSEHPLLPGFYRWLWDGEFCGSISFRHQQGTSALPPVVLGHIGYGVVPWKRQRGYATRALALMLPLAREKGLEYVEMTTDIDNAPSIRVIEANGGVLIERFNKPAIHGGAPSLRFRIALGK